METMVSYQNIRNPFKSLWHFYSSSLQRRPLSTKMAAAVLIFTTSDLVTQYIVAHTDNDDDMSSRSQPNMAGSMRRRRVDDDSNIQYDNSDNHHDDDDQLTSSFTFDIQRALSASSFGVIGTIYLHNWWNFLERFVNARFPIKTTSRLTNTLVKVLIDQSLSAPLYNWCYFFITNVVHSSSSTNNIGDRVGSAAEKATDMVGPLMLKHWKIWPAIHTINFYFTPVQNRVLVQNLALVGWSGYLSHLNHQHNKDEEETEVLVDTQEEEKVVGKESTDDAAPVPAGKRKTMLKRRKTILVTTGIDVAEVEVEEEES